MRKIGMTDSGETIVTMAEQDLVSIKIAMDMLNAAFDLRTAPVPAAAPVPSTPEKAAAPAVAVVRAKAKKAPKVQHNGRAKAAICRLCGADRDKVPWPKYGAVCLECNRKRNLDRYHALKGKKPPSDKPPAAPLARVPVSKSGPDRVRAALKRIEEREGLPTDPITHQTEKILPD